jgi:hypothetical protein
VLEAALRRYGLAERVELVVADSKSAAYPEEWCDLVVVAHEEVARLMEEIEREDEALFRREGGTGTLLHFVRA